MRPAKRETLLTCVSLLLLLAAASSACAAETHVFDPVLSLTGGCTTSEVDPVPDPGCPQEEEHRFSSPRSVTTDIYGDIYVASFGNESEHGAEGRIDVFDSKGFFLTEIPDPNGPKNLAVDSEGNLYVFNYRAIGASIEEVARYSPTAYDPEAGNIKYGSSVQVAPGQGASLTGLAINRLNDNLFVHFGRHITEYSSAAKGNEVIDEEIGKGILRIDAPTMGLAVDAAHERIYATDHRSSPDNFVIRALELAPPHALVQTIDGSTTPAGKFPEGRLSVAVDEDTGHVFVFDEFAKVVYEFTEEGQYVSTIEHSFEPVFGNEISIDNGAKSPNGAENPVGRYLFVPSKPSGVGHSLAFGPQPPIGPPVVESVSFAEVTQTEAELQATINPEGLPTEYLFEYTTKQDFEEEGFAGAQVAGAGELSGGNLGIEVSAPAVGLSPQTSYVFRVVATNEEGSDEGEDRFSTYLESEPPPVCPNETLRTGLSALLPDCRVYELVTPADTNSRTPTGVWHLGTYFATREASPSGEKVSFRVEGGSLPGFEGTGSLAGDPYLATRGPSGWTTTAAGPNGTEAAAPLLGSTSSDQGFSFWSTGGGPGSAAVEGKETNYIHYPDGHSALVGRGSIADELAAEGKLISEGGGHIVFVNSNAAGDTPIQLEPNAPPNGTRAIYDRTPDETTHVVSLLPGDVTPAAGENAFYEGSSLDGKGIAFKLGKTLSSGPLYIRYNDEKTYEVADEATFAGIVEGGKRVFYLKGGDLYAFDVESEETTRFTESGDITVVNVSADGSAAYVVSPSILTKEANPNGAVAQVGKENLYFSREGEISFVGTVTKQDVEGEGGIGLDNWVPHVASFGEAGEEPSRTTSNGDALLFESRAALDGYDPEGHVEIYRYDSSGEELDCLSCNPTEAPASGRASLESISIFFDDPEPFSAFGFVNNLRPDGRRAFFQSTEALVPGDTDGLQDVYEWEAQGVGSCERPEGCIYLISSGQSARADYIYAVSDSGDDVFFRTSDLLLPADNDETPSIYDARVGGGFPEGAEEECVAEGCRESLIPGPTLPTPAAPAIGADDNVPVGKKCPNGKHKVTKNGRTDCVKKKHHKHRHHRAGSKQKGAGK
jgi:hypothetical protein